MQLKYDIQGLGPVLNALRKTKGAVRNMTAYMKTVGGIVIESITRNFMVGGRPKWEPLKPSTIRRRRKGEGTGTPKPLRDTGVLMASIGRPNKKGYYELKPREVAVGTNVPYAGYQNATRPFMVLQKADEEAILRAGRAHLEKADK